MLQRSAPWQQEDQLKPLFIGIAVAALATTPSIAQTTQGTGRAPAATPATGPARAGTDNPGVLSTGTASTTTGTPNRDGSAQGKSAAGGNSNQAVATTDANANQPAKGSNSFTEGQAKSRLESNGFSNVGALKKDNDGIWRGTASKDGRQSNVWLDYKGNAGSASKE
jgi:hypothetical protein